MLEAAVFSVFRAESQGSVPKVTSGSLSRPRDRKRPEPGTGTTGPVCLARRDHIVRAGPCTKFPPQPRHLWVANRARAHRFGNGQLSGAIRHSLAPGAKDPLTCGNHVGGETETMLFWGQVRACSGKPR